LLAIILVICCAWTSGFSATTFPDMGWGEGCIPSMGDAETSQSWTAILNTLPDVKQHGPRPPKCARAPMQLKPQKASQVVKRSLFRAQRRAEALGMTWYKGQCLTPKDFLKMGMAPIQQNVPAARQTDLTACHQHNRPKKRLACFCWNGGGLASHRLDELKQWLSLQNLHIAVVTETRWTFQST